MKKTVAYQVVMLLLMLTAVGMLFGVIPSVMLAVLIAVIAAIVWRRRWLEEKKCQQLYPKDYAYCLYLRSKYQPEKPIRELIGHAFPQMHETEIEAWIEEFEAVESYKDRITKAGGIWILSKVKVEDLLVEKFPFLAMLGLRAAIGQTAYFAHKGGYHKEPALKLEEI
jgi:hypothetical protein